MERPKGRAKPNRNRKKKVIESLTEGVKPGKAHKKRKGEEAGGQGEERQRRTDIRTARKTK